MEVPFEEIEELVDAVLVCFERQYLIGLSLSMWVHDVIPLMDKGVEVYRVVTYGSLKGRVRSFDFTAISYIARISEEFSPVETKITISNGKIFDLRPEVELEKCIKEVLRGRHSSPTTSSSSAEWALSSPLRNSDSRSLNI